MKFNILSLENGFSNKCLEKNYIRFLKIINDIEENIKKIPNNEIEEFRSKCIY